MKKSAFGFKTFVGGKVADSLIDPKVEAEMKKIKSLLESLKKIQIVFMNTFTNMRPKERAQTVKGINAHQKAITSFINSAQKFDLRAPALKFGLENIRQKYQMLAAQWRRIEKMLDSAGGGGTASGITIVKSKNDPTIRAIEKYVESLQNLGHNATDEMVEEFRNRLESAYKTAKDKSGGRDLDIQIIQDGKKIKVRMEPK